MCGEDPGLGQSPQLARRSLYPSSQETCPMLLILNPDKAFEVIFLRVYYSCFLSYTVSSLSENQSLSHSFPDLGQRTRGCPEKMEYNKSLLS